jgi:predicted RNA-binding protein with PIN domain
MNRLLLIDACNILFRLGSHRDLLLQQGLPFALERLVEEVRSLHDTDGIETHFIVDGKGASLDQVFPGPLKTFSILYSPRHHTADTIIETWLMRLGKEWCTTVASEDRAVAHTAISHGADVLTGEALLQWAARSAQRPVRSKSGSSNHARFGISLESYFKDR